MMIEGEVTRMENSQNAGDSMAPTQCEHSSMTVVSGSVQVLVPRPEAVEEGFPPAFEWPDGWMFRKR